MIETSLMEYPNTDESDREALEIVRVLAKRDIRFRKSIGDYLSSHYHKIVTGSKCEQHYKRIMIAYISFNGAYILGPWMEIFSSIRKGTLPESYIQDIVKL